MTIADFNTDGRQDLFIPANQSLWGLFGVGDGTFRAPVRYGAGANPSVAVPADVNRYGRPDLVISNDFAVEVMVLLGRGDGSFSRPIKTRVGHASTDLAVGDLNGDGWPDLVTFSGDVAVRLGLGNGRFKRPLWYRAHKMPTAAAIGDVNGDGRPDLAVANVHSRDVSLLLGKGGGRFRRAVNYAAGVAPFSVAIADLDNDGRPDLAVANKNSSDVSVLLNAGPTATAIAEPVPRRYRPPTNTAIVSSKSGSSGSAFSATSLRGDALQVVAQRTATAPSARSRTIRSIAPRHSPGSTSSTRS